MRIGKLRKPEDRRAVPRAWTEGRERKAVMAVGFSSGMMRAYGIRQVAFIQHYKCAKCCRIIYLKMGDLNSSSKRREGKRKEGIQEGRREERGSEEGGEGRVEGRRREEGDRRAERGLFFSPAVTD